MKHHIVIIAFVSGVMLGAGLVFLCYSSATDKPERESSECISPFNDKTIHTRLVEQIESSPNVQNVTLLKMGFDGKRLEADVIVNSNEGIKETSITYFLDDKGYYSASGKWDFVFRPTQRLWPYIIK